MASIDSHRASANYSAELYPHLEPQNPPNDGYELHKIHKSTDFEAINDETYGQVKCRFTS